MIFPFINPKIHGWLDDLVVLTYLMGAFVLKLHGTPMLIAMFGGAVHFFNARITDYPQGSLKLIRFKTHAYVELVEGILVLLGVAFLTAGEPFEARAFLVFLGVSQLVAFSFSDYRWPLPA